MSEDRPSKILGKPFKVWPAWATALVALVVLLMQLLAGASTAYYAQGLSQSAEAMARIESAVGELGGKVEANSGELQNVRIALESNKLVARRLDEREKVAEDHEARIRELEKK